MAHFAEIDENNIVTRVLVVPDEQETRGHEYLAVDLKLGGTWLQTSYNTAAGQHLLGGTPLRKNYAAPGFTYDPIRDAFIPPKPFPSWLLNDRTCLWEPPINEPLTGIHYWDEENQTWVEVEK